MNAQIVSIKEVVENVKTYPSWTSNQCYSVHTEEVDKDTMLVYYEIIGPVKRRIKRMFPTTVKLTPRFAWVLGFLKGEGSNSLGKSNYRRFTITNTNPAFLKVVLDELETQGLFNRTSIIDGGINILHSIKTEQVARQFWAERLSVPIEKTKYYDDKVKTSDYGVCHIYISDVLLRRVVDEICSCCIKNNGGRI